MARNATDPTVAADGTLVYVDMASEQLAWVDRRGVRTGTIGLHTKDSTFPRSLRTGASLPLKPVRTPTWMCGSTISPEARGSA